MKIRKIVALLTAAVLAATVFAACGKTPAQSSSTASSAAAATPTVAAPMEITWLGWNVNNILPVQDNETQKYLEKKYNIKLTLAAVDVFKDDSWNLFWASGKTADYIVMNGAAKLGPLVTQNLIREIPDTLLEANMKEWLGSTRSLVSKDIEDKQAKVGGKRFVVPQLNWAGAGAVTYTAATRKDWMTNVGITKVPSTIDELEDMLKKYTLSDPDKNGKNDTYGTEPEPWSNFNYIFGAYGTAKNAYLQDKAGKVFYTSTSEDYKTALKKLASWYKAGYIDKEFVTDLRPIARTKFVEGKIGFYQDFPTVFSPNLDGGVVATLMKAKNIELVQIPAIKGPDGRSGGYAAYPSVIQNGIVFGKNTSDEKMTKIMQMLNDNVKDRAHYEKVQFGTLGVTYDMVKGLVVMKPEAIKADEMARTGRSSYFGMAPVNVDYYNKYSVLPEDQDLIKMGAANNKQYMTGACFVFSGVNDAMSKNGANILTICNEFYFNAITGTTDIDKGWDAYVTKMNAAGLKDIVDGYQKLADASK